MSPTIQNAPPAVLPDWLRVVQQNAATLRCGVVQLVVPDGRVTRIERTEKTRISATHSYSQVSASP